MKLGRRKKIEKYSISSCLRELKTPQPDVILKPTSFRFIQSARNISSKGVE